MPGRADERARRIASNALAAAGGRSFGDVGSIQSLVLARQRVAASGVALPWQIMSRTRIGAGSTEPLEAVSDTCCCSRTSSLRPERELLD